MRQTLYSTFELMRVAPYFSGILVQASCSGALINSLPVGFKEYFRILSGQYSLQYHLAPSYWLKVQFLAPSFWILNMKLLWSLPSSWLIVLIPIWKLLSIWRRCNMLDNEFWTNFLAFADRKWLKYLSTIFTI